MATRYVNGTTGNDSNDGLSISTPKLTFPTLTSGDTVYLAGPIRASSTPTGAATRNKAAISQTVNNVTVAQWAGQAQADFRGDVQLVQSGWSASTNAWQKTIATSLTLSTVVYDWDLGVHADGHHYGHLIPDTVGNVQAATGGTGRYNYNSGTGVLTVYLGGANPNSSGKPVAYCATEDTIGLQLNGTGNTISGITFSLYCEAGTVGTYGCQMLNAQNGRIVDCTFLDCGKHSCGFINQSNPATSNLIARCFAAGIHPEATLFVHYTDDAAGAMTGAQTLNCTGLLHRYRGLTDAVVTGLAGNTQNGMYAHADTGEGVEDVLIDNCRFTALSGEDGANPLACANTPAVSPSWDWSDFGFRVSRCTFTGFAQLINDTSIGIRRTVFHMSRTGPSGLCRDSGLGAIAPCSTAADNAAVFDACAFLFNAADGGGRCILFNVGGSGTDMRFLNCSVLDYSADNTLFFSMNFKSDTAIRARGSVFVGAGTPSLCAADSSQNQASHDFLDCRYYGFTGNVMSDNTSYDSPAEWYSLVDTSGATLGGTPFPGSPTTLGLTQASSLWTPRRATDDVVPELGVNNVPYSEFFGAYQYAPIVPQAADRDPNDLDWQDATPTEGDTYPNTGREALVVRNDSDDAVDVTIDTTGMVDLNAIEDRVISVAAGKIAWLGPFPDRLHGDADGLVRVTCENPNDVQLAVVSVQR